MASTYRAFLEFDQKTFKDGAIPGRTKELIALGIAQITQCPWCIDAHTKKAALAGAADAEIRRRPSSRRGRTTDARGRRWARPGRSGATHDPPGRPAHFFR